MFRARLSSVITLIWLVPVFATAQDRSITIDDLLSLKSVGSPEVSPDGQWVAYTVRGNDLEKDKSNARI